LKPLLIALIALALGPDGALAAKLDRAAVDDAQFTATPAKGADPSIVKAQVLLDRVRLSPGVIDGRVADNFAKAIGAFQATHGLKTDGTLTRETWDKLTATATTPVLTDYVVTPADVKGPFTRRIPVRMEAMARLRRLGYRSALERLAE